MCDNKQDIIKILNRNRCLFNYLCSNSDIVLKDLQNMHSYNKMIFPCDVIDLRDILNSLSISNSHPIVLFSKKFAEKYLKRFPIFLEIDVKKMYDGKNEGGLCLYDVPKLDINDSICSIIINEPILTETKKNIEDIINNCCPGLDYWVSNSIPGISSINPKLSSIKKRKMMKKCQTVNLPDMKLNQEEKRIFDFLIDVKKHFGLDVEFRVAGGWVRDKLMDKESDDIDIALSNMTGGQFAEHIKQHPKAKNVMGKDYTVPVNPEKSKHLETVAVEIFGNKIDFVNLRSETYGDTRVPTMQMGTPNTDAERRDLTINALFYNIETGKVEDYVGGLDDIQNKVLRTPQDPIQTFKDDPLRMLRAIRFKSRFPDFQVAPEMLQAMNDPTVQEAYRNKVSAERAGPELMKTMVGANPADAIDILFDTDLYKSVFNVPDMENITSDGVKMDQRTPWHKYNLKDHIVNTLRNLNNMMQSKGETDKMRGLLNLASLFHDFGKMKTDIPTPHPKDPNRMQYIHHEVASARMSDAILKSIGVGKDDRDIVNQIIRYHMVPHSIGDYGNKGMANFLRKTRMHGKEEEHADLWKYIFYHAQADAQASQPDQYDAAKREEEFNRFQQYVENPPTPTKILINGNDVKQNFPDIPPGPWIKDIMKQIQDKQDLGEINTREEAIAMLQMLKPQNNTEGTIAGSWYNKIKKAQQSRPHLVPQEKDEEIVKGPASHKSQYEVGMQVNDRRRGIAMHQRYGRVKAISGNKMKIIWFDKNNKEEIFDLVEDTVALSLIVGTGGEK